MHRQYMRSGFTLIETLLYAAILSAAVSMLVPFIYDIDNGNMSLLYEIVKAR